MKEFAQQLDIVYSKETQILNNFLLKSPQMRYNYDQDRQLLCQWEAYKEGNLARQIQTTSNSQNQFKICMCDFHQGQQLPMEVWLRIIFDLFHQDNGYLQNKFWSYFKQKAQLLAIELKNRQWPADWQYCEKERCLKIEMIKIFEYYVPGRMFMAMNLNQDMAALVDLRKIPNLNDRKSIFLKSNSWLPDLNLCEPKMLEQLFYANSPHCDGILVFTQLCANILRPLLQLFESENKIVNLQLTFQFPDSIGIGLREKGKIVFQIVNESHPQIDINHQKLMILFSSQMLQLQCPRIHIEDDLIDRMIAQVDYQFLKYYANMLCNKALTESTCLMTIMWTYVIPKYFGSRAPYLIDYTIFDLIGSIPKIYDNESEDEVIMLQNK